MTYKGNNRIIQMLSEWRGGSSSRRPRDGGRRAAADVGSPATAHGGQRPGDFQRFF